MPGIDPDAPPVVGQWAGPWDFESLINPHPNPSVRDWNEIAHAILLPDKTNTGRTRVLLICRRDTDGTVPWPLPRTFVWDPAEPTLLEFVDFPVDPLNVDNISEDPFCGGHAFTPEGDVLFVGGTDVWKEVNPPTVGQIWGHKAVWVFVNDPNGYSWVRLGEMSRERWYATATALSDGSILVTGHEAKPDASTYPLETEFTFERGTVVYAGGVPTSIDWQDLVGSEVQEGVHQNTVKGPFVPCETYADRLKLGEYPRLHSLLDGRPWWTGSDPPIAPPPPQQWPEHGFLDFFGCPGETITHRWTRGAVGAFFPQNVSRGSVHLIDMAGQTPTQYVFELGGADRYQGDISSQVLRMHDPTPTSLWEDDAAVAPDMNFTAFDGNYTILLDGSIIRTGGYGKLVEGDPPVTTYPARRKAEVFQPPAIFSAPLVGWKKMKEAAHERRYHSCAVLLPDGRVLTAGGDDTSNPANPEPSWFSVELFSPPYLFFGPRPRLTAAPAEITLGDTATITISAILRTTSASGEFRVALIAPGAATHAFDQGQKYVKLEVSGVNISQDTDSPSQILVAPLAAPSIPRGWYMLVVVNSAGIPSGAKWVKVHP